jgi:hypothetical protein
MGARGVRVRRTLASRDLGAAVQRLASIVGTAGSFRSWLRALIPALQAVDAKKRGINYARN